MDWFKSVQKQAQEAAEKLMQTDAAAKAMSMAQQAGQQAKVLAEQAKEVAKEAMQEANKGLTGLRQPAEQAPSHNPVQYGIAPELVQFAAGLTYTSFSEFPMDTLDLPPAAADQVLTPWQAQHAVLILKEVPQLQDLRFVLCPRKMDEYLFWSVYFTLCSRYLPPVERQVAPEPSSPSKGNPAPPKPAAAAAAAGASQPQASTSSAAVSGTAAARSVSGASPSRSSSGTAAVATGSAAAAAATAATGGMRLPSSASQPDASTSAQQGTPAEADTEALTASSQQQQEAGEGAAGVDGLLPDDDLEELLQNVQVDEGGGSQDDDIGSDLDAYLDDLDAELGEEDES